MKKHGFDILGSQRVLVVRSAIFFTLVLVWNTMAVRPQVQPKGSAPAANAELEKLKADQEKIRLATEVTREWFRRLNALDGSAESISRFVGMYRPDGVHMSGPRPRSEDQYGTVFYQGPEMIQKFAENTAKSYSRIAYYIRQRTVDNRTANLMTTSIDPWGRVSVAVEFAGSVNIKESSPEPNTAAKKAPSTEGGSEGGAGKETSKERRFTVPGTAFFEIQDGKISRLRIYYAAGESFEVGGTWILTL